MESRLDEMATNVELSSEGEVMSSAGWESVHRSYPNAIEGKIHYPRSILKISPMRGYK